MPSMPAIGIFDSGLGGLSVLREVSLAQPDSPLIYLADSLNAPYGEKPTAFIEQRTLACCAWLVAQGVEALVVACNTATAHTIQTLRSLYPTMPLIGVEPGIKPAALVSQSKVIGVLATERTLHSQKFNALLEQVAQDADAPLKFICQAGKGLVPLIEAGEIDTPQTETLLRTYLHPMLEAGADTLVLGCTHYPFLAPTIRRICGNELQLIDTGPAVARQVKRLMTSAEQDGTCATSPQHRFCSTYGAEHLETMLSHLLGLRVPAQTVTIA